METEKRDLERQVNEQKAKCEATEKRESERRQVEEKKHNEEIQFLKRTNQQLKVKERICGFLFVEWWRFGVVKNTRQPLYLKFYLQPSFLLFFFLFGFLRQSLSRSPG